MVQGFLDLVLLGSSSHPYLDACALILLFVTIRLLSARWSPEIPWACFKPGNLEAGMVGRDERLGVVVVVHNHRAKEQPGFDGLDCFTFGLSAVRLL